MSSGDTLLVSLAPSLHGLSVLFPTRNRVISVFQSNLTRELILEITAPIQKIHF